MGGMHAPAAHSYNNVEVVLVNPCELTASITAVANALACKLTEDELNLLGATSTQLGDTLVTIATHRSICGKDA